MEYKDIKPGDYVIWEAKDQSGRWALVRIEIGYHPVEATMLGEALVAHNSGLGLGRYFVTNCRKIDEVEAVTIILNGGKRG